MSSCQGWISLHSSWRHRGWRCRNASWLCDLLKIFWLLLALQLIGKFFPPLTSLWLCDCFSDCISVLTELLAVSLFCCRTLLWLRPWLHSFHYNNVVCPKQYLCGSISVASLRRFGTVLCDTNSWKSKVPVWKMTLDNIYEKWVFLHGIFLTFPNLLPYSYLLEKQMTHLCWEKQLFYAGYGPNAVNSRKEDLSNLISSD